jgi:predicted permease
MLRLLHRLFARVRYRHFDRDLAEELEWHRAMTQASLEANGLSTDAARRRSALKLGNLTLAREESRATWIPMAWQQLWQDGRYALRGLRRSPGFSMASIGMLAVGLGLIAGGYTVFNGLFVRGWAVPDNVNVFTAHARRAVEPPTGSVTDGFTIASFNHIRAAATTADFVAMRIEYFRIHPDASARGTHTPGMFVSDNLIDVLKIPVQLGTGSVATVQGQSSIVVSDSLWRRVFGSDPGIVGRTVWLNSVPVTVSGVTARGFDGLGPRNFDVVAGLNAARQLGRGRAVQAATLETDCCVSVAGRVRAGWTRAEVEKELEIQTAQYRQAAALPSLTVELSGTTVGGAVSRRNDDLEITLGLIGAALALVMLLTCANVGNLYLARSLRRKREIAVRLSLGASRARVVRQLLTEGLVMASIAGMLAFVATTGVPDLLYLLEDNATATMFAADWRVAAFTAAGVMIACLVVSLTPALQTTRLAWQGATATMTPPSGGLRKAVLAVQIAVAAVLVLSATLITRSIQHTLTAPADFALHTTSAVMLQPPADRGYDARKAADIRAALARALEQSGWPAGLADLGIGGSRGLDTSARRPGSEVEHRSKLVPLSKAASEVLELRLASGRWPSDDPAAREAVVNERLARQLWRDEDPLGRPLVVDFDSRVYSIVGVARDAHLTSLQEVEPTIHVAPAFGMPSLLVRIGPGVEPRARALVASVDPALTVTVTPLLSSMQRTLEFRLVGAGVAATLGIIALALAIVGVFGVFSCLVEERGREIGIRLALGASRAGIGRALFDASRGAVASGLVAGLALSLVAGMSLRRFLFGLSPLDPISYLVVGTILVGAAVFATAIPLRRAMRVDPATTLKAD